MAFANPLGLVTNPIPAAGVGTESILAASARVSGEALTFAGAVVAVPVAVAVVDAKFLFAHDAPIASFTGARVLFETCPVARAVHRAGCNFTCVAAPSVEAITLGGAGAVAAFLLDTFAMAVAVFGAVELFAATTSPAGTTGALAGGDARVAKAGVARFGAGGFTAALAGPAGGTLARVWRDTLAVVVVAAAVDVVEAHSYVASLPFPAVVALADAWSHALPLVRVAVIAHGLVASIAAPARRALALRTRYASLGVSLARHAFALTAVCVALIVTTVFAAPSFFASADAWTQA